ncbi:MAG: O-antigen ligase family protein, partial [Desulfitobacteriaceae bacterium]|nr:O-antigen ligase family protein [Desulfitobacteriaceae bacterium]
MLLFEERTRTNPVLIVLMLVLGLSAIFENALNHELIYYASFAIVPLTLLLLLRNVAGNGFLLGMHLPLFILIISSGLTLFWTINLNETMGEFYKLILYLLIYWLAAVHLKPNDVAKLVAFLLILGSMIALVGILSFLFIEPARITSLFNNPNPFGIYLAMLSLMGFGLFIRKSPTRFLSLALVLITDALILTGSRGSLISFIMSFPVIFLNLPKDKLKNEIKKLGILFLLVGISVYIISIAAPLMQDTGWELNKLNNLVLRDSSWGSTSVEGRLSFWLVAWNMIKERPL